MTGQTPQKLEHEHTHSDNEELNKNITLTNPRAVRNNSFFFFFFFFFYLKKKKKKKILVKRSFR